jgi:enamine deaminase RidA (YjgF/YER057c/UK114 family)
MTANTTTAEDRLAKLGIHLPDAPTPFGAYVPAVQTGNLLFLSGMLATSGHTATVVGGCLASPASHSTADARRGPGFDLAIL